MEVSSRQILSPAPTPTLHNFGDGTVPNDGLNPQGQPVQGRDGYFYGVTLNGGSANEGTVYKINTLGIETVLHSFGDNTVTNDGLHPVSALIQGADGNFYGTTPARRCFRRRARFMK